jgi:hypothetical protein
MAESFEQYLSQKRSVKNDDFNKVVVLCQNGIITGILSDGPCQVLVVNYCPSDLKNAVLIPEEDGTSKMAQLTLNWTENEPEKVQDLFERWPHGK